MISLAFDIVHISILSLCLAFYYFVLPSITLSCLQEIGVYVKIKGPLCLPTEGFSPGNPTVEIEDLKSLQCQFESGPGDILLPKGNFVIDPPSFPSSTTKITRRQAVSRFLQTTAIVGGGSLLWEGLREAHAPQIVSHTIYLPHLPPAWEGLKVAHLSDLHIQRAFPGVALFPMLDLLRQIKPDLIALTGDYVVGYHADKQARLEECVETLQELPKIARMGKEGVFVSFGNHDFPQEGESLSLKSLKFKNPNDPDRVIWQDRQMTPLIEEVIELARGREKIYLAGLRSLIMRPTHPTALLSTVPPQTTRIVLWHEPDGSPQAMQAGASLMLSGHTHGGQIIVPGYGPLLHPQGGEFYSQGLFAVGQMSLYVTRGIGLLPPLLRVGCPPEVTLLTLKRKE